MLAQSITECLRSVFIPSLILSILQANRMEKCPRQAVVASHRIAQNQQASISL